MRILSAGAAAMRHSAIAVAEALIVAAIVAALLLALSPVYQPADFLAGTESAQAAKGGNGGGKGNGKSGGGGTAGSSALAVVMVQDANGNGAPNWADTITFDVSTTQTATPYVALKCYQGGTLVYSAWAGFYPDYPWPGSQLMPLSSPSWSGGAADCTARLVTWSQNGREQTLATMGIRVDA